ncbi:hypothetical protein C8R44DRAFT_766380 [Mycena epipterygia]|nr:hypothetical protein C8R44DRAFT_766380 [Mycena epipterygia]
MSDERSVEARLLAILTLNPASLIDHSADSAYWSDSSEAVVPEHITAALQNTAEFSHSPELRRLARLGLAISKKAGNAFFDPLAREVCLRVHDAIFRPFPVPHLRSLIRLLEEMEEFSRNSNYSTDQVEEYHRRLRSTFEGSEGSNASSTSFQVREFGSSARRVGYPPATSPTASYLSLPETVEPNGPSITLASQIYAFSIFIYHVVLLRLPATYAFLASDSLCSQDSEASELELWDTFTDILLKQWKTLGLFSTLIFGATLTMFQIPSVTSSSVLSIVAHSTLLCVVMSLIYTSLLSVYFGGWRSRVTAERWVQEIRAANPHRFWNFWVLISLPAVWTCWSIFLFLASMVLFVWPIGQYDSSQDSINGVQESLGIRIFLMTVVLYGAVHLALAISLLRRVSTPVRVAIDV